MRNVFVLTLGLALVCAGAGTVFAQAKPADYYSSTKLKQDFDKLAAESKTKKAGSGGSDLSMSDTHALKLSYRRETGGAEVHQHFDDIMVVEGGSATIVTGGSLVDATTGKNGEMKGKSIQGGTSQVLSPGDIIHVPAGTPHQLLLNRGKDFRVFVVKIHE